MLKTFKKLWQVVDISVDLIVDLAKAIQRELNETETPSTSTEAPTNK
jgi:hypothetical protein